MRRIPYGLGRIAELILGVNLQGARMDKPLLSYDEIRALRVRDRFQLMEDLWRSIWDKSPRKWFPLAPLIREELEKRCEDGRL